MAGNKKGNIWHVVGMIAVAISLTVIYANNNKAIRPVHAEATQPVGQTTGWTMTFNDEFSGTAVDTNKWSYQSSAESDWSSNPLGTGNPGNQQLEFDKPANCSVANGILSILAKPDNITSENGTHYNWSSCMLNTSPSYAFRYGYIEIRAQLPSPKGFWPAFWTWAKDGVNAPGNAEIDAFEFYSDNHTNLYQTNHNVSPAQQYVYKMPFDPTIGYHTYAVDIEPTGTDWYVDGVKTYHTNTTSGGETNILLDNFVYSQIPPQSGSMGTFKVDYVRAWKKETTTLTPIPTSVPTAAPTNIPTPTPTPKPSSVSIIIDNPSATVVGSWYTGSSATGKYGSNYRYKGKGSGTAYLQYTPSIPTTGSYKVYEWHSVGSNRTTTAKAAIKYNGGTQTVPFNEQINGGKWNYLGTFTFTKGTGYVRISDSFTTGSVVMADAIKFVSSW